MTVVGGSEWVGPIAATKLTPSMAAEVDQQFDLDSVDPVGRMEALIYGPPGTGKTVFATTFPGPLRWIAADGRNSLKSIIWAMKAGKSALTNKKDLVAYAPTEEPRGNYIATPRAFNLMQDMVAYWFTPEQVDKWKSLVLDSLTEINMWAIDQGLSLNNQFPTSAKPLSTSDKINRQTKVRLLTGEQDYKSAMGLIEGFLRNTRSECAKHGKNLIILCHEWQDSVEDDKGNVIITARQPLLLGQLRTRVVKDFDDVWHMEKYQKAGGPEIKVSLHGDAKTIGKSRWGTIVTGEVEPDYRKMIEVVRKYHGN